MSSGKRMAALAIGVSDARPLPFLAGAVNGASAFHEWAQGLGYESRLVTDEYVDRHGLAPAARTRRLAGQRTRTGFTGSSSTSPGTASSGRWRKGSGSCLTGTRNYARSPSRR